MQSAGADCILVSRVYEKDNCSGVSTALQNLRAIPGYTANPRDVLARFTKSLRCLGWLEIINCSLDLFK